MNIETNSPVGEIAAEFPGSIPLFKEKGIEYCCGGNVPLWQACDSAGVSVGDVIRDLERLEKSSVVASTERWENLLDLINHILRKHHDYTKTQLDLVEELAAKVHRVHGERHPELEEVKGLVRVMAEDLRHHMAKEEQVAFPYLARLEDSIQRGHREELLFPYEVFKSQPQHCLMKDHEATGDQLKMLRSLTLGFQPPAGACVTYRAFYRAMDDLEQDIHQHVHLENNILFPMAERLATGPSWVGRGGARNG